MQSHQQDIESVRGMRPEEKLRVMNALIRQAWELKVAVIRAREPGISESEIRARAWKMVGGERP
jgi:hypothetical protein